MIKSCFIIFGCLALGEALVEVAELHFPSSIIGMLLLTAFLELKWIKLATIKPLADFLLGNLAFFFVPSGVALMLYFDLIAQEFFPIAIATVVSTIVVLCVTAWTHSWGRKLQGRKLLHQRTARHNHPTPPPTTIPTPPTTMP